MREWKWEENSILYNSSPYRSPKDIFQAVCNEIGRFYTLHSVKYTKSKRQLTWVMKHLRCEIRFWSSHSNICGEYVAFEVVSNVFALDKTNMERNGVLNYNRRSNNFNIQQIDSNLFYKIVDYIDETVAIIETYNTKEGIDQYHREAMKAGVKREYFKENPNNQMYYDQL